MIGVTETVGPDGFFDNRVFWALAGVRAWSVALAIGLYFRYLGFLHRQALATVRRQAPRRPAARRRIQDKLDVRNRVEIAAWSWEHHIACE